jgi:hypothetical protein
MPGIRKKRKSVEDDNNRSGDRLSRLDACILSIVERERPETVERLVGLVQGEYGALEEEIIDHILGLQSKGKLRFRELEPTSYASATMYLSSRQARWYWAVIGLSLGTVASVFGVEENMFPLVYARYVLGSLFVLFLPGYSFMKALFPKQLPLKTGSRDLDTIERLALSIGMSLALVPMTGLVLNYTPWGIRLVPITLSLLALTVVFATAAAMREYSARSK